MHTTHLRCFPSLHSILPRTIEIGKSRFSKPVVDESLGRDLFQWAKRGLGIKVALAIGFGMLSFGGVYFWAWSIDHNRIVRRFEKGKKLDIRENFVRRPSEEAKLIPFLSGNFDSMYIVVVGEHGIGKTALTKYLCNCINGFMKPLSEKSPSRPSLDIQPVGGVLYISVPNSNAPDLVAHLAREIDFDFSTFGLGFWGLLRKTFLGIKPNLEPSMELLMEQLKQAAKSFKAKHGRPLVLVLDDINRLLDMEKSKIVLKELQNMAKDFADSGDGCFVFLTSEGKAFHYLKDQSPSSRMAPPIEFSDFLKPEAFEFLKKQGVTDPAQQEAIYNLVNGRPIDLLKCCQQKGSIVGLLIAVDDEFEKLVYSLDNPIEGTEKVLELIEKILSAPNREMSIQEFRAFINNSKGLLDKRILYFNVFARHYSKSTISMQSRLVENFFLSQRKSWWKHSEVLGFFGYGLFVTVFCTFFFL